MLSLSKHEPQAGTVPWLTLRQAQGDMKLEST